jgi:DNA-directed RNA polymerase sigma subunit (sigma70/sigma32)
MSKASERFVRDKLALVDASKDLRQALRRYEKTSIEIAARVEREESGADALKAAGGPVRRREITDVLERFEAARHQVRLAMFALASEEGTSTSELGRQLGVSRQLAYRLANEAKESLS